MKSCLLNWGVGEGAIRLLIKNASRTLWQGMVWHLASVSWISCTLIVVKSSGVTRNLQYSRTDMPSGHFIFMSANYWSNTLHLITDLNFFYKPCLLLKVLRFIFLKRPSLKRAIWKYLVFITLCLWYIFRNMGSTVVTIHAKPKKGHNYSTKDNTYPTEVLGEKRWLWVASSTDYM
jgi:hypothetical protein